MSDSCEAIELTDIQRARIANLALQWKPRPVATIFDIVAILQDAVSALPELVALQYISVVELARLADEATALMVLVYDRGAWTTIGPEPLARYAAKNDRPPDVIALHVRDELIRSRDVATAHLRERKGNS